MNRRSVCFLATLILSNAAIFAGCLERDPGQQTTGASGDDASSPADTTPASTTTEGNPVDFRSLSKGADLKYPSGARLIITDGQTWEQFWTQAIEGRERPDVDFGQEMVIAVLMQESPNGCLRVQVTDVTRGENSTATVHVDVQGPPVCELAVMGQAYHIIAMPAADVVLFQEARV